MAGGTCCEAVLFGLQVAGAQVLSAPRMVAADEDDDASAAARQPAPFQGRLPAATGYNQVRATPRRVGALLIELECRSETQIECHTETNPYVLEISCRSETN